MNQGVRRYESMPLAVRHAWLIRSGIESHLLPLTSVHDQTTFRSRYVVQVYHLRGFHISMVESGRSKGIRRTLFPMSEGTHELNPLLRRLEKTAIRCLYTLGLSDGEVILSASGERWYALEQITPASKLTDPQWVRLYKQQARGVRLALQAEEVQGFQLMMGMDPEFLLVDQTEGKMIPASQFLDREGEVGCDAVHMEGMTTYPVAELRPNPSMQPRGLLVELMHAMATASYLIHDRSLIWQAGGMPIPGLPLGGHLHFSGILLTPSLLHVLDNYLALPIVLLEDTSCLTRRPKYGFLGDFRRQPHGGFEYRTLPSFLISPLVAKGIVYMAYLLVGNYKQLVRRPLNRESIHKAYYEGNRQILQDCLHPLFQDMISLTDYPQYAKYIDPLIDHMLRGNTWDESRDIRPLWNVPVL
ncbi:putative amidoligase domain-containing protein [Paenibacillus sp. IHBB 10380]|uniref:putative amidoligase domain-containing protein n=1 Tax=Paenibacillus sp. IHBB 10380 TaxID=1566358 RepID=UPI0006974E24|nr:hypothetical protein [Paenibacillus sp. IHBB 10380]